mmetsp:Transcript_2369/g.1701  ORF Transcript_2369/g.1701 Transcript_2369/m.1701 type:complete len:154 (-) Transcript_2369:393-854(-)|eukprot:CAMPEP_0202971804 /NCGR_PEP_ID=MMETSP1396-20130829/31024_1 /ASSEMBLY_ACC=CAM_ASM_000872 /TAXON_ID= /ORGANISM="Pseudokeronopsis sp., Strain Brazil" /LENGTH=153 /DNA_ID=CAMNT_0049701599 /DNA_START=1 /DNA_END=462 /DNA_ORIENTATION=+
MNSSDVALQLYPHFMFSGFSCLGFLLTYESLYRSFLGNKSFKEFQEQNDRQRADFLSRINANLHAVIVTIWAVVAAFNTCEEGVVPFYYDFKCFDKPTSIHFKLVSFSLGYFWYDFIICVFKIRDYSALGLQTIIHHFMAIVSSSVCLYNNNF